MGRCTQKSRLPSLPPPHLLGAIRATWNTFSLLVLYTAQACSRSSVAAASDFCQHDEARMTHDCLVFSSCVYLVTRPADACLSAGRTWPREIPSSLEVLQFSFSVIETAKKLIYNYLVLSERPAHSIIVSTFWTTRVPVQSHQASMP